MVTKEGAIMSNLALFLFGPPRIELDDTPIKISRHKAIALMAYLSVTAETHSRNTLATLLWPNQDQHRARAALRRILVTLNKAGIGPWLKADRETIALEYNQNLWVDVTQFRQQLATCLVTEEDYAGTVCIPVLTQAVNLYQADFLTGFSLRDSSGFDEWQLFQTENLRYDLTSALARLIRCHSALGEFDPAIAYARRWLKIDPLYELAHRQLMQLYAWSGQRTIALRQYQECAQILKQELDVSPTEETSALYKRIQRGEELQKSQKSGGQFFAGEQFSAPAYAAAPLHNFPTQPTPFIGRETELAEIAKRLQNPDCRLLTLVGPGGIGKTRLAIQTAIEQSGLFGDGLYFVPLASASSPDFLVPTLADSLNISLDGKEEPQQQLINQLKNKKLLLVMDNFEHLIKRASLLTNILTHAPNIKFLVTSRERLNLQGEWTFEVKGMNYPADTQTAEIEGYSAVTLFLRRAYRTDSDFLLTDAEKPYIIRICQLVQGVPLAIELAASWVRVLSCQEITAEIERMYTAEHSLDFLATSLQDVPKRHQSLRMVFEHSWQLLSTEEKRIFRQLSVFKGGYRREAIEAVTGASLILVSALVDKSLLIRSAPRRYEMHQLLRQFAAKKLQQFPGESEKAQDRHCEYYAAFLQEREKQLKGAKQKEALAEIAREIENIRACWRWAISRQKIKQIKKSLESLWYFYAMYSWFQEGAEAFEEAVEKLQAADQEKSGKKNIALIGQILAEQGWFLLRQGLYEEAKNLLQQSVAIFERLNDHKNMAAPLHYLGILAGEVGEAEESKELLEKALSIYRKANNQWGIAWSLSNLAYRASELDKEQQLEAKQLLQESLAIYKTIGNKQGIAVALNNLGYLAYRQEDYPTAKELLEESLTLRREVGYPRGIAVALNNLGHVTGALGDYQTCKNCYYEALKIAKDIHTIPLTLAALGGLAAPLLHEEKPEQALELVTFVLHHPASNKETLDRAAHFLSKLKSELPSEIITTVQSQIKEHPEQLEAIVTQILAEGEKS